MMVSPKPQNCQKFCSNFFFVMINQTLSGYFPQGPYMIILTSAMTACAAIVALLEPIISTLSAASGALTKAFEYCGELSSKFSRNNLLISLAGSQLSPAPLRRPSSIAASG